MVGLLPSLLFRLPLNTGVEMEGKPTLRSSGLNTNQTPTLFSLHSSCRSLDIRAAFSFRFSAVVGNPRYTVQSYERAVKR